jgi:hypothetical protein
MSIHILIFYLRPSIMAEINNLSSIFDWSQSDVNVNSHTDLPSASIYYKSQLAMWIHYWHTQTQIWIEIAMWMDKNELTLIIIFVID